MKISADWLTKPSTQLVMQILLSGGYEAFFVGGCVRNTLRSININTWVFIFYQAVVVSLGAHLLMFYLYKFYTVGQIFPSYSLFPIFGIGLSFLIFGEMV